MGSSVNILGVNSGIFIQQNDIFVINIYWCWTFLMHLFYIFAGLQTISALAIMKYIILLVAVFVALECDAVLFPNVRYLGRGYNVLKGNPNDQYDPGYLFSVLTFTQGEGRTSPGGRYKVPDQVQAFQVDSCSYKSQVSEIFGAKSYQEYLDNDVSFEAEDGFSLMSARFSASTSYRKVSQSTKKSRLHYAIVKAKCIAYELAVNYRQTEIEITEDFRQAVKDLPYERLDHLTMLKYFRFIDTYGTHIITRMTMGAEMVVSSEFTEDAWTKMEKGGVNIAAAAQASSLFASLDSSYKTDSETQEQRQSFESRRRSYRTSYRGMPPPTNCKWETWAQSVKNSPAPISYKLLPLAYLINSKVSDYGLTHNVLDKKKKLLVAAYHYYCISLPGCEPNMRKVTSDFQHSPTKLSCPPDYHIVSCGIKNTEKKDSNTLCDSSRYALSLDTECECGDENGAACISWCSLAGVSIENKNSTFDGSTIVSCPEHYKVLHYFAFFTVRCTQCKAWYCYRKSSVRPSVCVSFCLSVTLIYRGRLSRDYWTCNTRFPIGIQFQPTVYLGRLLRY